MCVGVGEGTTKGATTRRQDHQGPSWRLATIATKEHYLFETFFGFDMYFSSQNTAMPTDGYWGLSKALLPLHSTQVGKRWMNFGLSGALRTGGIWDCIDVVPLVLFLGPLL